MISREHLVAADEDSAPDEITYRVGPCTNGEVALIGAGAAATSPQSVKYFTQVQIDEKKVTFLLRGCVFFIFTIVNIHDIIESFCHFIYISFWIV